MSLLIKESLEAPEDIYSKILLLLANRAIQHIESARLLIENGLYGDSFSLLRSIMSDLSMMQYLRFHPELQELFWNEKEEDYHTNKNFKKAFSESAIEKDLISRGMVPFTKTFSMLSKTSHASAFGSQLFGSEGKANGQYHFNYGPRFESKKALMLMDIVASCFFDVLTNILAYQEQKGNGRVPDSWKQISRDATILGQKLEIYSIACKETFNALWPEKS